MDILEIVMQADRELLLVINGLHSHWADSLMVWVTKTRSWIPLYLFLTGLIIYKHRKASWMPLLAVCLVILLCDQLSSGIAKPFFERLRPCHDPSINSLLSTADGCGGKYGFFSGHAATSFGIAVFIVFLFKDDYRWIWWMIPIAVLVSYSRAYLGVHYPGDLFVGASVGSLTAWGVFRLYKNYER